MAVSVKKNNNRAKEEAIRQRSFKLDHEDETFPESAAQKSNQAEAVAAAM